MNTVRNFLIKSTPRNFSRQLHITRMAPVAVGDAVPSVDLFENNPGTKVNMAELCAGKKVVIFGVPGAFTPGCSKTHLPGRVRAVNCILSNCQAENGTKIG